MALVSSLVSAVVAPSASAASCPNTEVVFARGTGEPPGVGTIGQSFVSALGGRVGSKSLRTYAVNYPATSEWSTGLDGIRNAVAHVESVAATCPGTAMVLGGYSQGAAVMGFVTSAAPPDGVDPATVPQPLSPEVSDHVAAVVLFGTPNERAMNFLGEPPVTIGPLFAAKTLELCVDNDPVCSDGLEFAAHNVDSYTSDGMVERGADFAASRLQSSSAGPARTGFGH